MLLRANIAVISLALAPMLVGCGGDEPSSYGDMEGAVAEACGSDLNWSNLTAGEGSLDVLGEVSEKYDLYDGIDGLRLRMRTQCPAQLDGFDSWVDALQATANQGSEPAEPEQDCGRLGGWVADQQGQGAFTPQEYDSWLQTVDQCFEDQGR